MLKTHVAMLIIVLAQGCPVDVHAADVAAKNKTTFDKEVIALSLDNDLFTMTDRDFTAGMAFTHSGQSVLENWRGFDRVLGAIDGVALHDREHGERYTPTIEFGSYGFTPDKIGERNVQTDDRPYASLLYLSTSRAYQSIDDDSAWTSTLTIGALGLGLFESVQNGIHDIVGSDEAKGWRNQISDGGEPTFRYQAAYHNYWGDGSQTSPFKTTWFGSVGYLTEVGFSISTRRGRIASPDYRFNPELITYGERLSETLATPFMGKESYFWGGIALKARFYNVFLQGQFRDSVHTLGGSDLRPLIAEAWIGYTQSIGKNFKLSAVVRTQTSEIKEGDGNRTLLWGGLVLSKSI